MSELDMVRLNVNANVASAGQTSSVGTLGGSQPQLVQSSPQLKAMDKLATDMTVPGGNNLADLSKKLETVSLDGSAKVAQGMQNVGAANGYLSECDNKVAAPQAKPLSGMKADLGQANQAAVPNPNHAAAGPDKMPPAQNPIGKCLDTCFGEKMPAAEKQSVAAFYGKAADFNGGVHNQPPKAEAPKMGAPGPAPKAPEGAPQAPKAPMAPQKPQVSQQVPGMQPKAAPPKGAGLPGGGQVAFPHPPAKPAVPNNNGVKNVPSHNEGAVRPEPAVKEEAVPASRFEDLGGRFGLDDGFAANAGIGDVQHANSVLSQYKAQAEDNVNLSGSEVSGVMAGQPFGAGMGMQGVPAEGFNGLGTEAVGMPVNGGNPMVNPEGAPKQAANPLDMVGSTAMSSNMANLEQLVNMDLMAKFVSGMSMQ